MLKIVASIALVLISAAFAAESPELTRIYQLYRSGQYRGTVSEIESALKQKPAGEVSAALYYLKGQSEAKLQNYDLAAQSFRKAIESGTRAEDIYFELGQSLYASQQMKEARAEFEKSKARKYKPQISTYYMAYISQTLEEFDRALALYAEIIKVSADPEKSRQAAMFQTAEVRLERAELIKQLDTKKDRIKSEAIPAYEQTAEFDRDTPTGQQAQSRLSQIRQKYFEGDRKNWDLKISQTLKYDSNVITQADGAVVQLSDTSSLISTTALSGSWLKAWGGFSISPSLAADFNLHSRRTVAKVYQNDSYSVTPALGFGYAHSVFGKNSRATLDYSWNYLARDLRQVHSFPFYNSSHSVIIGEQISFFGIGPTTLKFGYKKVRSQDPAYDAKTPSFTLAQMALFKNRWMIFSSGSADFQKANDIRNDLFTYRVTNSLTIPELKYDVTVRPSFTYTIFDTREQSTARGTEAQYSPGVAFIRKLGRNLTGTFDYTYTKKNSLDTVNYAYNRHLVGCGVAYSF